MHAARYRSLRPAWTLLALWACTWPVDVPGRYTEPAAAAQATLDALRELGGAMNSEPPQRSAITLGLRN